MRIRTATKHGRQLITVTVSNVIYPRTIPAKAGISLTWAASPPKRRRRWRHMVVRFLPSQEWSAGERGIVGGFGDGAGDNWHEIPAFAGMVCGGTGVYRQKYARLLPAQLPNSPPIPIPPEDHSCVGRNLLVMGGIAA